MKRLTVEFDLCDSEYMTALRLVSGAVCSAADADVDTLEDFKVCVTESALILKNGGFASVKAVFDTENGVSAEISGSGGKPHACGNELSLALIGALVNKCDISNNEGIIDRVTLRI